MARERLYRPGVGIVLMNSFKKVWVGRRIDSLDAWQMPQGGIDDGEIPEEAVFRELLEEVGTNSAKIIYASKKLYYYDLPSGIASRIWEGKYRGQEQQWFLMEFLGQDSDINIAKGESPEFDDWRWSSLRDLPDTIVHFKRKLYEDLLIELSPVINKHFG